MSQKLIHSYIQTFYQDVEKEIKEYPWIKRKTLWSLSYDDDGKDEEEEEAKRSKPSNLRVSRIRLLTVRGDVRGAAAVAVGRLSSFDVEVQ